MKRIVSISLLSLLLCHILAHVLVLWTLNWQEERDLSNRLMVYRTVDSIVEFYVPLHENTSETVLPQQSADGFAYKDSYYEIVRQEVMNDTLHILGYVNKTRSFWQQDLLGFIKHQFSAESGQSQKKAGHLLKNLVKEYYTVQRLVLSFPPNYQREAVRIPAVLACLPDRPLPVHSPPPKA